MSATTVVPGSDTDKRIEKGIETPVDAETPEPTLDHEHFSFALSAIERAASNPLLLSDLSTDERNRLLIACGRVRQPSGKFVDLEESE